MVQESFTIDEVKEIIKGIVNYNQIKSRYLPTLVGAQLTAVSDEVTFIPIDVDSRNQTDRFNFVVDKIKYLMV